MPTKIMAGIDVDIDDNGHLTNMDQWNKEIAEVIASEEGITELTPKHWEVIEYLRNNQKEGNPLSIRKVGKSGLASIKEFYELFPGGPLKKSSKIAGIPRPAS